MCIDHRSIIEYIHTINQWKIRRRVMNLVRAMLISQNETMNGTGYPFWISKKDIPAECRIYNIIRAYDAICANYDHRNRLIMMEEWNIGWYFDIDIFNIFRKNLEQKETQNALVYPICEYIPLSSRWIEFYQSRIWSLLEIKDIMNQIDIDCDELQILLWNQTKKNSLVKNINELSLKLRDRANIRTIFILTRHGRTESDNPGWPPWGDEENLIEEWIIDSQKKWDMLRWLDMNIFTSPLPRAIQTAEIIYQKINNCIKKSIPIGAIVLDEAFKNPRKNSNNGRYNSYLQKLFVDDSKWIMEFLLRNVSCSEEWTNLIIVHKDSGRNIALWLENLFLQDEIQGKKASIKNDTILTYLFQWDKIIEWNLLFPIYNIKKVIREVNIITQEVLWVQFYEMTRERVDLIRLHDTFLDFFDFYAEKFPEKIPELVDSFSKNLSTHNFEWILRANGLL